MNVPEKTGQERATAAKINAASYLAELPPEVDPARDLLRRYSSIAPDRVDAHIFEIVRLLP